MRCAACRRKNRPDAKFCAGCGEPLARACPSCSSPIEAADRFCAECGERLGAQPEALRRRATVMFCDLSGYTALNERLDPEEVEAIMSRLKDEASRIVEELGGTVNQFVGDEVMALFGMPVAHGDDACRAVLAALRLHRAVEPVAAEVLASAGMRIALHTAINTGLLVGRRRDDREGRYTVTGDAVNACARLLELAAPGDVLVLPETQRLIEARFSTEALPPARVKGKSKPIAAHRVLGERLQQAPGRRFVGRREELALLHQLVREAAGGSGRLVLVRGEAGIGKSALVRELRRIAENAGFRCHAVLVLDFGVARGRDPISALVAGLLGVEPAERGEERLRAAVDAAIHEKILAAEQCPFADDLLALAPRRELRALYEAMDDEARRQGRRQALADLVRRASAQAPLLVIVEDLHWADPPTVEQLAALAELAYESPFCLALTTRPEDDDSLAPFAATSPLRLDLGLLQLEDARALARELGGADCIVERCIDRAGGHPLFLEQLVRNAESAAGGPATERIPGSIEAIVLARIDKLAAVDREALQAASVLGQRFAPDALRWLLRLDAYDCRVLVAQDLLRPHDTDYLFSHALVQEAIYGALLLSRRRELHVRAAAWFATRDPLLVAEHLERAEDDAAAAAFLDAAKASLQQLANEQALGLVTRGLRLSPPPAVRHELLLLQGRIHHDRGAAAASIESHRAALQAAGPDDQRCRAFIGLAAGMRLADDYDGALEALARAEELARAGQLGRERAELHQQRGNILFPLGDLDGCLREHRLSLEHAKRIGAADLEAAAQGGLGDASYLRGDMRAACEHFGRAVELGRALALPRTEVANWPMLGWARAYLGELEAAVDEGAAAAALARRIGHGRAEMIAHHLVGWVALELDEVERAAPAIARVDELACALASQRFTVQAFVWSAYLAHAQGDAARAAELAERAAANRRPSDSRYSGAFILGALARFGRLDDGAREATLAEGEALLARGCAAHNHLWFYRDGIEAALERGEWDRAERYANLLLACTPAPLPWSELVADCARALSAVGRRSSDDAIAALRAVRARAAACGLRRYLPRIDRALEDLAGDGGSGPL